MNQRAATCLLAVAVTLWAPSAARADGVVYSGVLFSSGPTYFPTANYNLLLLQDNNTGQIALLNLTLPEFSNSLTISGASANPTHQGLSRNFHLGNAFVEVATSVGPTLEIRQEVDWQYNGSEGSVEYRNFVFGSLVSDYSGSISSAVSFVNPEPSSWMLCALGLAGLVLLMLVQRRLGYSGSTLSGIQPSR